MVNPVTGAFGVMWNSWISVLIFLSKGEITATSAMMVSLVMIVVGVLMYTVLKSIVFAALKNKISEIGQGAGGEAISNWVPFVITVAIVFLMVYTGVILLMIPFLWVLFIAMLIGIGWLLWSGAKATIATGMDISSQFPLREKFRRWRNAGNEGVTDAELDAADTEAAHEQRAQNQAIAEVEREEDLVNDIHRIEHQLAQDFAQERQAYESLYQWLSSPTYANQLLGVGGYSTRKNVVNRLAQWQTKYRQESAEENRLKQDVNECVRIWKLISANIKKQLAVKNPNQDQKDLQNKIDARLKRGLLDISKIGSNISFIKTGIKELEDLTKLKWMIYERMMNTLRHKNFEANQINVVRTEISEIIRKIEAQQVQLHQITSHTSYLKPLLTDLQNMLTGARVGTVQMRQKTKKQKVQSRQKKTKAKQQQKVASTELKRLILDVNKICGNIRNWKLNTKPATVKRNLKFVVDALKLARLLKEKELITELVALEKAILIIANAPKPNAAMYKTAATFAKRARGTARRDAAALKMAIK